MPGGGLTVCDAFAGTHAVPRSRFGESSWHYGAGRYRFTGSFALRGTASNGFRASSLAQTYYGSAVTLVENGQLVQAAP